MIAIRNAWRSWRFHPPRSRGPPLFVFMFVKVFIECILSWLILAFPDENTAWGQGRPPPLVTHTGGPHSSRMDKRSGQHESSLRTQGCGRPFG
ncbi:hypothetical protein SBV1_1840002 [Verrucomicrobia bacterium]|nr:hypothetical protein SBV1_1840002 [Verrucomicrobiota bacterium]